MKLPQRLETPRLVLRRHARSDAPELARLLNNWNIVRWLAQVPFPYTERDAADWIGRTSRSWAAGSDHQFVAALRSTGQMVGHFGLRSDPAAGGAELGYWLGEPYWGQGYGSEAACAVVAFGFDALALDRIWATALPDNAPSLGVLRKAGLTREGVRLQEFTTLQEVVEVPLLAISRAAYLQAAGQAADVR